MIKYDFKTYNKIDIDKYLPSYMEKKESILEKLSKEKMTDWFDLDRCINKEEVEKILSTASLIRKKEVFLVIGIGGSYLGAYSFIKAFSPYFPSKENPCEVLFAGYSLSSSYLDELLTYLKDKDVVVNFISKSGSTLEVSLVFEKVYALLKEKYDNLEDRVIITTDKDSPLSSFAKEKHFPLFFIPKNIGGRYSVFTPVGLLPMAVFGIDIKEVLQGGKEGKEDLDQAFYYAMIRDILYKEGKKVESFGVYEEKLLAFTEWLKQLFGESQGKEKKGLLPTSVLNTRDLHSLGQFYQQGSPILFETNIEIEETKNINIEKYKKTLDQINSCALKSVALAHLKDEVYTNVITMDRLTYRSLARLMYFFMTSCAIGGYFLCVCPFDQPGVEAYKKLLKESIGE